ncbi:MAG: tetratricopeptide repeat protein [Bacteroidales bacterium]|nr:tetratricopeptide repeat protein [Bacteroidales bacterium]
MASLKASYKYLFLTGFVLVLAGCSVEKNTGTTRFYHGLTSRFNIYFNGYESFKAGLMKIINGYSDDYAELLRVFEYSDPSTPSLCSSDMEKAIQKASKVISLKSITAKPEEKGRGRDADIERDLLDRKEYNEWVDDSYFLVGRSRFYKHEYNEASAVFDYCILEANDPAIKMESSIWLSRIYNETGKYSESYRILSEIEIDGESSRVFRAMYYTTLADLFIKQKKYSEAIDPLEKAIDFVAGKRTKYRLTYLLAQLNEQTGNPSDAISLYRKVIKMNPPYDVVFNARINIAGVFDVSSGNPGEISRELEKMLKDSKNKEFLDQIYFALGNLSMKEGNEAEALEFFRKSASAPSRNQNQKGRSYLALANYFYNKPDFIRAGKYYDSTVYFLSEKHPDYQLLKLKSQDLNALVSQLTIIQDEDSLQRVALMPESERDALISSIISSITKAEIEGKPSEYSDRYNLGQYYENERRFQGNIEQEGKWYFYNQSALSFGRSEFRRRWGERRLEDNWRRSNKARVTTTQSVTELNGAEKPDSDTSTAVLDYKKPEFYLRNLPLNDSLLAASNGRIAGAYLNAGTVYYEKMNDIAKASELFEKLISRYPASELVPQALYFLYNLNKENKTSKSEAYRQRLLEKYPTTEYASILSDPEYYAKKLADLKMAEQLYQEAYKAFIDENFIASVSICDEAVKKFSQDVLVPKFLLLRAYSVAKIRDERSFRDELSSLIKLWPGTDESKKASDMIAFLNQEMPELKIEEDKEIAAELFIADTTVSHIFALIILDPAFNINQATFDVISYNIDNFTNNSYRTEGVVTDKKYIIITVSGFKNFSESLRYYNSFPTAELVRNPSGTRMMTFLISNENLKVLNSDQNPERYQLFFIENYLTEK